MIQYCIHHFGCLGWLGRNVVILMFVSWTLGVMAASETTSSLNGFIVIGGPSQERLDQCRCRKNLIRLNNAKEIWALLTNKPSTAIPNWDDLVSTNPCLAYLRPMPICPSGGTYSLNMVNQPVACSIGGDFPHVWPIDDTGECPPAQEDPANLQCICANNLRHIQTSKMQWALEHHQPPEAQPAWSDLITSAPGYLKEMPYCPSAGTYSIGVVQDYPSCSIQSGEFPHVYTLSECLLIGNDHLNICQNNLARIDGVKSQWALEYNKSGTDIPTWEDIVRPNQWWYLQSIPVCPDLGIYTIRSIDEYPTCSYQSGCFPHRFPVATFK